MVIPEDNIQKILGYVRTRIESHFLSQSQKQVKRPFLLALSGLQGSGKSTYANQLASTLRNQLKLKVIVCSLDDFYQTHENLVRIRNENPENGMLRVRGQPGTHDEELALRFFKSLSSEQTIKVPAFDKSRFNGEGDRVPEEDWEVVSNHPPIDIVVFEGWCVGFQALDEDEVEKRWREARHGQSTQEQRYPTDTLRNHSLQHIKAINNNLRRYNNTFMSPKDVHYLIHLDTELLQNVYQWRIEQEHKLREIKGTGMSDDDVVAFVMGYMPAYELYLHRLQTEAFALRNEDTGMKSTQLRVVLDTDRSIVKYEEL